MIRKCTQCPCEYDETQSNALRQDVYCSAECEMDSICMDLVCEIEPLITSIGAHMYNTARAIVGKEPVK